MKVLNHNNSQAYFKRALKVIPSGVYGHLGPLEGCFIPIESYPLFSSRAEGTYFWDVDDHKYIDYMCAYGPNILGYNDPDVNQAAIEQLSIGNCISSPSYKMVEFAELLVDTVDMADWAFFAKNGGDVTSFAIMVARAATGKRKTILFEGGYHGVAPWTQKYGNPGILQEDTKHNLYVKWNDYEQLEQVVEEHKDDIACIMATPYHHPVFVDNEMPLHDYWQKVRALCTKHDIVLAIDDVRCGFRLDLKGSDHYFDFKADLMCFCKALANGFNVSALCGIESLKDAAANVMYTGSYWQSAVPFAAGIACINKLKAIDAPTLLREKGLKLTNGLHDIGSNYGFDLKITGEPSMWYMRVADDDSLDLHQRFVSECVKRGIFFTNHHNQFINCALTDEDIDTTLAIADEAFKILKKEVVR